MAPSTGAAQKHRSKRSYRDKPEECRQYLRKSVHIAEIGQFTGERRRGDVLGERSQRGCEMRSRSLAVRTWRKADCEQSLVTKRTTWRDRRYDPVEFRGGQPEAFVKLRMHVAWEQGFADDMDSRSRATDCDRVSCADMEILRRSRADGRLTWSSRTAPEMRVKVIGVIVVPAIGRTEKTGAPT